MFSFHPGRKGIVDVQFNWIFVLVAGALILILFTTIAYKQYDAAEARKNNFLLTSVNVLLTSSESNEGTTQKLPLAKSILQFSCNTVRIEDQSQQFENVVFFAPSTVFADNLIAFTKKWSIPYHVGNYVYLSSPRVQYYIIGQSTLADEIKEQLPSDLEVEVVSAITEVTPRGEHIRLIFTDQNPTLGPLQNHDNERVTALRIEPQGSGGLVRFYAKVGSNFALRKTFPYLGTESLLGAVISDDADLYGCSMNNAFKKSTLVSSVLKERTTSIEQTELKQQCKDNYLQAITLFDQLIASSQQFGEEDIQVFQTSSETLDQLNQNLRLRSCALLY